PRRNLTFRRPRQPPLQAVEVHQRGEESLRLRPGLFDNLGDEHGQRRHGDRPGRLGVRRARGGDAPRARRRRGRGRRDQVLVLVLGLVLRSGAFAAAPVVPERAHDRRRAALDHRARFPGDERWGCAGCGRADGGARRGGCVGYRNDPLADRGVAGVFDGGRVHRSCGAYYFCRVRGSRKAASTRRSPQQPLLLVGGGCDCGCDFGRSRGCGGGAGRAVRGSAGASHGDRPLAAARRRRRRRRPPSRRPRGPPTGLCVSLSLTLCLVLCPSLSLPV
ncbi:MAG: hypothetical protein BJ554DRAFT_1241, partial [Olpidium bornovanus]